MRLTKISIFLLIWLGILAVSPFLAHSASPYAGNQSNSTKPITVPIAPPVAPVSKPIPIQNPTKRNAGATGDKK